jgi:hypothetical protein
MKEKLTVNEITYGVKSAVTAYLLAKAYAEVMRKTVDSYYREALEIFPHLQQIRVIG